MQISIAFIIISTHLLICDGLVNLNTTNFIDEISKTNFSVVQFYGSRDPTSVSHQKTFLQLVEHLANSSISIFRYDCDHNPGICKSNDINKIPKYKMYHKMFSAGFLQMNLANLTDIISKIYTEWSYYPNILTSVQEYNDLVNKDSLNPIIIGFFQNLSLNLANAFFSRGHEYKKFDIPFYISDNFELLSELKTKLSVRRYLPLHFQSEHESRELIYRGHSTNLSQWIKDNFLGNFPIVNKTHFIHLQKRPLFMIISNNNDTTSLKKIRENLYPVILKSLEQNPDYSFVISTLEELESEVCFYGYENIAESPIDFDLVLISDQEYRKYAVELELKPRELFETIEKFNKSELKPLPNSQLMQEFNTENMNVDILTGFNFNEKINSPSHDKLIMFYSQDDTYSKSLINSYLALGDYYQNETTVKIYMLDIKRNDFDSERFPGHTSVPRFYWMPINKEPELFQGSLRMQDIHVFVCKRATFELISFQRDGRKRKQVEERKILNDDDYIKNVEL